MNQGPFGQDTSSKPALVDRAGSTGKVGDSSAGLVLNYSRSCGQSKPMATSLRGISSTACREDLGAMIRRLALSPFGYFVRRPVLGPDQPMAELLCSDRGWFPSRLN